jgi:hypothetical protein
MQRHCGLARLLHHPNAAFGGLKKARVRRVCEAQHIREVGQGAILVLEPMELRMQHDSFWRTLSTQDRRVVRNWTWGVLIVYGAIALTVFGVASLGRHSPDPSKGPAGTEMTAKADTNHVRR